MPELDDFLSNQDYEGAISLLNHKLKAGNLDREEEDSLQLWLAHCYYRLRNYEEAANVYTFLMNKDDAPAELGVYLACCKFYLKQYIEAKSIAEKCPKTPLCIRLMMNVSLRLNDEKRILTFHSSLGDTLEDRLSLAGVNYSRMHYQDAIEVYTSVLQTSPNLIGLNVNMALCYAKMDYPHVAYNLIKNYLRNFPNSPFAKNLLLSVLYRTITSKTTVDEKSELARNIDQEGLTMVSDMEALLKQKLYPEIEYICKHNLVLFKNCETALQVLPSLMKHIPEARVNLILYHLNKNNVKDAISLCKDFDPVTPYEFLVKALTFLRHGQETNSREHLKIAENFFQMVGESGLVQDTIAGRQSSAAYLFLSFKFDDVITYLKSIEAYFTNNDDFLLNLAQAYLMYKNYVAAEKLFIRVSGPERDKILYKSMLARCYVRNKKPQSAWDMMLKTNNPSDRMSLLKVIAQDCYIANEFYYASKAFHEIEISDPTTENWSGKRGACAGLFRQLANHKTDPILISQMREVVHLVAMKPHSNCEFLLKVVRNWAETHNVNIIN
ncbi:Intraflagellar transport protein 56 homolog [Caenorhabditis elegans]|nr:Intraflagellar transport protein 56 homolog [Caenorhabditis elegans]CCD65895.1 Intraflagellar transport protein 56 homolog [Caenorhabditis elegans]|eukprot:NP_741022.1 Intraflagellar transport protein 56 homolog [Caenorhabditis elegans]